MRSRLSESDDALTVHAEVPGFSAKELEIGVEPHRLTISGKRVTSKKAPSKKTIYKDYCLNQIFRAIDLPTEVDSSKVTATLKDGVLELMMPRVLEALAAQMLAKEALDRRCMGNRR